LTPLLGSSFYSGCVTATAATDAGAGKAQSRTLLEGEREAAVGDSEGRQVTLPAVLRPLLEEAGEAYADWRNAQDDVFGDDATATAHTRMMRALRLFAAGATDAGMNQESIEAALQRRFPEAPLDGLFEPEPTMEPPVRETLLARPQASSFAADNAILGTPLGRRYGDAYAVARTIIGLGNTVKILAYVIGGLLALSGVIIWLADTSSGAVGQGSVVLGGVVGVTIFVLGVLVSAVGQILRATLDTAVNTSPLLTKGDVSKIMSVD
jgi:hypothetical protein